MPRTCPNAQRRPGRSVLFGERERFRLSLDAVPRSASPPSIGVTPRDSDFGQVDRGGESLQIVTISNGGPGSLSVDEVALMTDAGSGFWLRDGVPPAPLEIQPDSSVDLAVVFAPTVEGPANGTLRVSSHDPHEPIIDVALTGIGVSYDDQAMELLESFDELVAGGGLVGRGRGTPRISGSSRFAT